jgi:hypothetical protein
VRRSSAAMLSAASVERYTERAVACFTIGDC